MSKKREFRQKVIAFISAVSFMAGSNYGTMATLAVDSIAENSPLTATAVQSVNALDSKTDSSTDSKSDTSGEKDNSSTDSKNDTSSQKDNSSTDSKNDTSSQKDNSSTDSKNDTSSQKDNSSTDSKNDTSSQKDNSSTNSKNDTSSQKDNSSTDSKSDSSSENDDPPVDPQDDPSSQPDDPTGGDDTPSEPSVEQFTTEIRVNFESVPAEHQENIMNTISGKVDGILEDTYHVSYDNDRKVIAVAYESIQSEKQEKENVLKESLSNQNIRFSFDEESYISFKMNQAGDSAVLQTYYVLNDWSNICDFNFDDSEYANKVIDAEGKKYILMGVDLHSNLFSTNNGYYLTNDNTYQVNGAVTIQDDKITMKNIPDEKVFAIEKTKLKLKFQFSDMSVKHNGQDVQNEELFEVNWLDIGYEWIEIHAGNPDKFFINSSDLFYGYSGTLENLLQTLKLIDENTVYTNGVTKTLSIVSVPDTILAKRFLGEEDTEGQEFAYHIKGNNIDSIPLILKENGKDYYLSMVRAENGSIKYHGDFSKAWDSSSYYAENINYSRDLKTKTLCVYYKEAPSGDYSIDEAELRAKLMASASVTGKRNSDVYTIKSAPSTSINLTGLNNVDKIAEIKAFNRLFQSLGYSISVTEDPDDPEKKVYTWQVINSTSPTFLKVFSFLDNEDKTIEFSKPFYFYVDQTAPKINEVSSRYQSEENPEGWSAEHTISGNGQYRFTFKVSDDMPSTSESKQEYQDAVATINDNQNLNSVKEITVGGLTFSRPVGGWVAGSSVSANPLKDTDPEKDYRITITPQKEENGKFTGTFSAVLTLIDKTVDAYRNTVYVSAKDDCDNSTVSPKSIEIKIDTHAPQVNEISIENLKEGLFGEMVLQNIPQDEEKKDEKKTFGVEAKYSDEPANFKGKSGVETASGIATVTYEYAEEKNNDGVFSFKDAKGAVKITLKDKAGNESVFYYDKETDTHVIPENGSVIVTDVSAPQKPLLSVRNSDYTDSQNRRWYNNYPEMYFFADDSHEIRSEIELISVKVNGTEKRLAIKDLRQELNMTESDMVKLLDSGKLYLAFEPEEGNNQNFFVYICSTEDSEVKIPVVASSEKAISLGEDGKLTVFLQTMDFAGNFSQNSDEMTIYIDNNHPVVYGTFSSDELAMRKFGSFANRIVSVGVPVSDTISNVNSGILVPSSGYQDAILRFAGGEYHAVNMENRNGTDYAVFTIPAELLENSAVAGEFSVIVIDNVKLGSLPNTGTTLFSDKENSSSLIIENIPPVLTEARITGDNHYQNESGEDWYSSDITIDYGVTDADSGIAEVNYTVRHDDSNTQTASQNDNFTALAEKTRDRSYSLKTEGGLDGQFVFDIQTTDNAENFNDDEVIVYKDITSPYISGFSFASAEQNASGENSNITANPAERFSYFYDDGTIMTVTARDDGGASSGINTISCVLYNTDGSVFQEYSSQTFTISGSTYSTTFLLPEGFKGDVVAWVTDNVNNRSEERSPDGYVSENEERNRSNSSLSIDLPSTSSKDPEGLPLYNSDVTATLSVGDTFSGISKIEWSTSDFEGWDSITVDANGNISGNADGWSVNSTERNIALRISRDITVSSDTNDDFIRLKVTDNSGNVTTAEERFSIDKQVPVISVAGISPSTEKRYFNSAQRATVTIRERNFTAPTINGNVDSGFKAEPNARPNQDDTPYSKEFSFTEDGTYRLNVEAEDLAGNDAERFASGEFVIDTVKPTVKVDFQKQNGVTANVDDNLYINQPVKAIITVTEENFSGSNITVYINEKAYTPESWSNNGSVHTAEIPLQQFTENQKYTVRVSGKDLAENSFDEAIEKNFIIDNVKPKIEISGIKNANKGDVTPTIQITDQNIESRKITLTRNGIVCEVVFDPETEEYRFTISDKGDYIIGRWTATTLGDDTIYKFILDNFPNDKIYDGFYRLDCVSTDKATNSAFDFVEFSVNRFGSTFYVSDMEKINGNYLNKPPTIVIKEVNVDKHSEVVRSGSAENSDIIIIMDKGTSTMQISDYTVTEPQKLEDESGYEYTYTISPNNFDEDANYNLSIQTRDAAGNDNVSSARNAEIEFTLDTHEPSYKCDDLIDDMEYREAEKTFRLNSNEELQHIVVTTNLNEVLIDESFVDKKDEGTKEKSYVFIVPAAREARYITVEITDFAANKTIQEVDNLLVTDNVLSYLLHKKWFRYTLGTIGGLGILGGGAYFVVKRRRED